MVRWYPIGIRDVLSVAAICCALRSILSAFHVDDKVSGGIALASFFVGIIIWAQSRCWQYEGDRFRLDSDNRGDAAIKLVSDAHESIFVTHFGTTVPSEAYVAHMLDKLDQGVHITRILGREAASDQKAQSWLGRFRGRERYAEFHHAEAILPFDFAVIDDRYVILYLPAQVDGREYNRAMIFENQKVALIYRGIFERLRRQAEMSGHQHWVQAHNSQDLLTVVNGADQISPSTSL